MMASEVIAQTEEDFIKVVTVCWGRLEGYATFVYEWDIYRGEWKLLPALRREYDTELRARGGHAETVAMLNREDSV